MKAFNGTADFGKIYHLSLLVKQCTLHFVTDFIDFLMAVANARTNVTSAYVVCFLLLFKFSTKSFIELSQFTLLQFVILRVFLESLKPHKKIRIESTVTADTLASGSIKLRGRPPTERTVSIF